MVTEKKKPRFIRLKYSNPVNPTDSSYRDPISTLISYLHSEDVSISAKQRNLFRKHIVDVKVWNMPFKYKSATRNRRTCTHTHTHTYIQSFKGIWHPSVIETVIKTETLFLLEVLTHWTCPIVHSLSVVIHAFRGKAQICPSLWPPFPLKPACCWLHSKLIKPM